MKLFKMKSLNTLQARLKKLEDAYGRLNEIYQALPRLQEALGRIEARQLQEQCPVRLQDNEFRVYSQWGEDGIIQFLLRHLNIQQKLFIEFGVQDYRESNTRFLLKQNNWSGLVIDADAEYIQTIKRDPLYWQHNLKAVQAFITRSNINQLMTTNGIQGEIGLLSIDIDGNDYWVWEAVHVVKPVVVVVEYNHRFGPHRAVTIRYDAAFRRYKAHPSGIYYGASLKALTLLGESKGYDFVGCNQAGNNAFFIRKDARPELIPKLTPEEGFVVGQFRESRDEAGALCFLSLEEEQRLLSRLELIDVELQKEPVG